MDALLEQFDERIRRIVAEALSSLDERAVPAAADPFDDATLQAIRDQAVIANKTYLTRAEAAKYLGVSERSISEWSARSSDQNPFPVAYAGGEPRYRRTAVDEWAVAEARRQRLKLAG
jgi:DNA-binding transcriptional regulator YiaG